MRWRESFAVLMAGALAGQALVPAAAMAAPSHAGARLDGYGPVLAEQRHGWGRGYRHRDRIDAGDVLGGILVIGAIAAIADAVSDSSARRLPEPSEPPRWRGGGLDRAADLCVDAIERGYAGVASVDLAERGAGGWRVEGTLEDGEAWSCRIDNAGRVTQAGVGVGVGGGAAARGEDGQWSDEDYAQARARLRDGAGDNATSLSDGPLPAYPGGPLPGEEGYEEALGARPRG